MCYHTCHAVQHYTQCKSLLSYICKPTMRCAKLGDAFSQVLQQLEVFFIGKREIWGKFVLFLCFFKWEMPSGPGDPRSSGFSSCVSAYFFVYGSPKPCLRLYRGHSCNSNGMSCSILFISRHGLLHNCHCQNRTISSAIYPDGSYACFSLFR